MLTHILIALIWLLCALLLLGVSAVIRHERKRTEKKIKGLCHSRLNQRNRRAVTRMPMGTMR